MKILLIMPAWPQNSLWGNLSFKFPYLSLTTIAALTPEKHRIKILDENVESLEEEDIDYDLVGISVITPLAPRAYELGDYFKKKGVPVVMGGVHVSALPDEALKHADAVVVGEAESIWDTLLEDLSNGTLKKVYTPKFFVTPEKIPIPKRVLIPKKRYFFTNTVQTTRGCPYKCEFCCVTEFFGNTYRMRPISNILKELEPFKGSFVFFVDDNIVGNRRYARELFQAIKPLNIRWFSQASLDIANHPSLLSLAAESGCWGLFVGFESLTQDSLNHLGKKHNKVIHYKKATEKIHRAGIGIQGSFIFGHDLDGPDVFQKTLEFVEEVRLDAALFSILTPYPGTHVFNQLKDEGRIFSYDWSLYDMNHLVYEPMNMSRKDLIQGFYYAYKRLYSARSFMKRLFKFQRHVQVFLPQNIGFRLAWKKVIKKNPITHTGGKFE